MMSIFVETPHLLKHVSCNTQKTIVLDNTTLHKNNITNENGIAINLELSESLLWRPMSSNWTGCMCFCRFAQIDQFCPCCEDWQPLPVLGYKGKQGEKLKQVCGMVTWKWREWYSYIRLQTSVGCKGSYFIMGNGRTALLRVFYIQYFTAIPPCHIHLVRF